MFREMARLDRPAVEAWLATFLERQGWEARTAETAEDGLRAYAEFRPDLVLLDHNLPGMDGLQALERLRAQDPEAKVVMMTGFGSVDLAVSALKAGALDYLTKPLALGELRLLVRNRQGEVANQPYQPTRYAGSNALPNGVEGVPEDLFVEGDGRVARHGQEETTDEQAHRVHRRPPPVPRVEGSAARAAPPPPSSPTWGAGAPATRPSTLSPRNSSLSLCSAPKLRWVSARRSSSSRANRWPSRC